MKKTTRILTLLIVVIMLVSCFAACNDNKPNKNNTTPNNQNPQVTTPPNVDPGYELTPPRDLSVNGDPYTYRAYVRSDYASSNPMEDGNPAFACIDFWIEEIGDNADALEYATYQRNQEIENAFNVRIRQVEQADNMVAELRKFYQNNERYDLTIILAKSAAQAATQNLLKDLNSLETIDLTHESYDQNSIKELSMGGKLYYLSGDMNTSTMEVVAPTVVNLGMYEKYQQEILSAFKGDEAYIDIYNIVLSKKWTMDTMLTIAQLAVVDADTSDGVLNVKNGDTLGYFQYAESTLYYFYGAGGRVTEINEEGYPEFVVNNNTNQDIFNYIYDHYNQTKVNWMPNGYSGPRKENFFADACLFTDMTMWDIRAQLYFEEGLRYGVLPNPLFEEGNDYKALVHMYNTAHLWAIPSLANDDFKAQVMMQALAEYSNVNKTDSTMDAYYNRTLYLNIAGPDTRARNIMKMIQNAMVYDIALLYDWGGWVKGLQEMDTKTTNEYAALVSVMQATAYPKLEETIEAFKNPSALPSN